MKDDVPSKPNTFPRGGYGWSKMKPDSFADKIQAAAKKIYDMYIKKEFDAVAFTGSSGSAIAFYIAAQYRIPLIYVRKAGEKSHGFEIESNSPNSIQRYLIVDDFIESGETVRTIIQRIKERCDIFGLIPFVPVGVFCYDYSLRKIIVVDDLILPVLD